MAFTRNKLQFSIIFFTKINKYVIFVNNYFYKMTPEAERFNGWAAMLIRCSSWCLCNNWPDYSGLVLMENTKTKIVEKEKIVAEKLNEFAMIGFVIVGY